MAAPASAAKPAKPAKTAKTAKSKTAKVPLLKVDLLVRLARCKGDSKPVRELAWVASHIAATNKIFARWGILVSHRVELFEPRRCELVTRAHRHSMAGQAVAPPAVTVVVMKRVQDVDVPSYNLKGVHWRYRGRKASHAGRRWVFLTARARPPVLAHELCHFFGLPHDRAGGNLMTPGPSDPVYRRPKAKRPAPWRPVLTRAQGRRLRRGVARHLRTTGWRAAPSKATPPED